MKKLLILLTPILLLLVACSSTNNKVTITVSPIKEKSLEQCVALTPSFEKGKEAFQDDAEENIIYHWETTDGEFLGGGQSLETTDDFQVIWTQNGDNSSSDDDASFEVSLTVIGSESQKTLATKKITLSFKDAGYEITQ